MAQENTSKESDLEAFVKRICNISLRITTQANTTESNAER